jgi:hypothetical protein
VTGPHRAGRGGDNRWLSKAAVLWAMYDANGVPARLVSTLIAVAAHAGADGCGAYPSAATVALVTRKSETQAKRDIAELERLGLLRPGDRRPVARIRADRRPNVYDMAMPRVHLDGPRRQSHGVHLTTERGASRYRTGSV